MSDACKLDVKGNGNGARALLVAEPLARAGELPLHPAWLAFLRYCRELGHGEIERLKIQDGLPVLAEVTREKVKFT